MMIILQIQRLPNVLCEAVQTMVACPGIWRSLVTKVGASLIRSQNVSPRALEQHNCFCSKCSGASDHYCAQFYTHVDK